MKLCVPHTPHMPFHVIKINELFMPILSVLYIGHSPTDGQVPSNQKPHLLKAEESGNAPKIVDTWFKTPLTRNTHPFLWEN